MTVATPLRLLEAPDEQSAVEELHRLGCTDGLPVVVPTPERVDRMAAFAGGLDPDVVIGVVGPQDGEATVEKIAVNAVMAGCLPEYLPVVIAAVEAVCDAGFELGPIQATTHNLAPLVVVNGPIRGWIGVESGTGALGPGFRANASIGRALRLVLLNVGGGRPGVGDMSLLGHPGKFTYCLGEAEELSPFEPLHVARGLDPETSAVTVVPLEAPHSVVSVIDAEQPEESARRLLSVLAGALANVGSNSVYNGTGTVAVILNPDHAHVLASVGHDRTSVQNALFELAIDRRARLRSLNPALVAEGPAEEPLHVVATPSSILVLVAGGDGTYSVVMPTWAAGDGCVAVTRPVRSEKECDVPLR
jgi:hypothetical protein